jgi:hypothetical protein
MAQRPYAATTYTYEDNHLTPSTGFFAMPVTKQNLTAIKRLLISARIAVQEAGAQARRMGDDRLAARLRDLAVRMANELDGLDYALRQLP